MHEALGASQVLSYLYKLSDKYEYHLVSLEKSPDFLDSKKMDELHKKLVDYGIHWYPVEYKTQGLGKKTNFVRMLRKVIDVIAKERIRFVHCRSYITAVMAYLLKKRYRLSYLFDTRNFAVDERADVAQIKKGSGLYNFLKKIEKKLYLNAAGVVILSETGKETVLKDELFDGGGATKNIGVITTCVDLERFVFHERDYNKRCTIGYIGTAVGWYDFGKTVKTLAEIKKQTDFHFLVFNSDAHGQHEWIKARLLEGGLSEEDFTIEKVAFKDMPQRLKEIDLSLFYIHPYFSKRASAATKLGELMASGIPVLTNKDVGDHEFLIKNHKVGKIIDAGEVNSYNFAEIFSELRNKETAERCRQLAESYFSLETGVKKYRELYKKVFV